MSKHPQHIVRRPKIGRAKAKINARKLQSVFSLLQCGYSRADIQRSQNLDNAQWKRYAAAAADAEHDMSAKLHVKGKTLALMGNEKLLIKYLNRYAGFSDENTPQQITINVNVDGN